VRTYKPDRRVYSLVTEHYQTTAEQLVFVTANGWDATGAAAAGLRVAWCNRSGLPAETYGPPPAWTLRDLGELGAIAAAGAAT
jgi:2-haloacid dehalogenase